MGRPLKLLPLLTLVLVCSVVAAQAITWTSPTFPFYGSAGTGPIYFASSFQCTNGSWSGGLIRFTDFNYAGSGNFGTWGIGADAGVSISVLEMAPDTYALMTFTNVAAGNATLWFPALQVVNCTNAAAYTWDNATKLLELQSPAGGAQITISFTTSGAMPSIFIIPQWFVDQGGVFFGVTGFFTSLMTVMSSFVAWFASAILNVVDLIYWIMMGVVTIASFIITWFGRGITFMIRLFTAVGSIFDRANTTVAPYSEVIAILFSADGLSLAFVIGFASWFGGLSVRASRGGSNMFSVLTGDVQVVMYWVGLVWEWSWTVFNFVYGVVMQFVSLLWGLIP